jgi:excinuclease ABC subunit B
VETLERVEILRDLRMGMYDVLVGINLLREGLDLPEVSLVAILDADKEGFLRSDTSLIQTIGRAARHIHGKVVMYADKITDSMARALDETVRRRKKQDDYNKAHGISPVSIHKEIRDITARLSSAGGIAEKKADYKAGSHPVMMPKAEFNRVINEMESRMKAMAKDLEFERAAALRDEIYELKQLYADMANIPPWEKAKLLSGELSKD